jgi:cell division protein FtsB
LAASTQATSSAATAAVNKALANVAETTTQAAHVAAESTLSAFAAAANEGKMVRSQLIGTIAEFKREWRWIVWVAVALAFATIGVMGYGFVWWQRQELKELATQRDKLTAQREKLAAEVSALQAQADEGRRGGSSKRPK